MRLPVKREGASNGVEKKVCHAAGDIQEHESEKYHCRSVEHHEPAIFALAGSHHRSHLHPKNRSVQTVSQ